MISCLTFKKRLYDFIYGTISEDIKKSMEVHVENCPNCQIIYEEELQNDKAFKDVINIRNVKFNSSRDEIIKNIDKNRYSKRFSNKLYHRIRRNIMVYAASAVLFFGILSGSLYFYDIYKNNLIKKTAIEDNYGSIENIKDSVTKEESSPNIDSPKSSTIETEIPLPETSNIKEVQEVLDKTKKEPLGTSPWIFGYVDSNKIIFYNQSALLAYSYNGGKSKYYSGIDLDKIDAGYSQGSIHTYFNFSPKGDYVVINNGIGESDLQNNKYNMYLYSFKSGKMIVISNENKFFLKDTWSSNSNFYAFADKNGERIFIHDILSDTNMTIPFNKGDINSIFISDYGDIVIETSNTINGQMSSDKYLLRKDNSYESEEYIIPGIIIGIRENSVLYYNQDTIYELNSGKSSPVKKLGAGFNIEKLEKKYATFTDGIATYIYDYNKNFYKHNISYPQDYSIEFSPDLKKLMLLNHNNAKIIYPDNIENAMELGCYDNFSSNYTWFGNNNLIRISQKYGSDKLGDFSLYKTNIISNTEKPTSKSKDSDQSNEKYAPGILIDNSDTDSLDKANIILVNYFEYLKSNNSPDNLRIKDYKIKIIKIEKQSSNNILFSVEYSILPYGNYIPSLGKSKNDDGWYNSIYNSISVFSENNIYYIENISS